MMDGVMVYALN